MTRSGLSRREVALVAGVLLLPIPLLATTGLNLPLPGLVERAVASLLPAAVSATEPGAPAVAPGSQAPSTGSATTGSSPSPRKVPSPSQGTAAGAASGLARTTVGGSIGVDAPGTGEPPPDGGTPSGGEPNPGADPGPQVIPATPLTPPDIGSGAPDAVPDEPVPGDELPVDVSLSANGAEIDTDSGASIDATTDNGPGVDVDAPPLPSVPPVPVLVP